MQTSAPGPVTPIYSSCTRGVSYTTVGVMRSTSINSWFIALKTLEWSGNLQSMNSWKICSGNPQRVQAGHAELSMPRLIKTRPLYFSGWLALPVTLQRLQAGRTVLSLTHLALPHTDMPLCFSEWLALPVSPQRPQAGLAELSLTLASPCTAFPYIQHRSCSSSGPASQFCRSCL